MDRIYVLDFAGGGAVHLIGGMAGLVICLFAKFKELRKANETPPPGSQEPEHESNASGDQQEQPSHKVFWDWMYPVSGGEETVSEAALGVIILWFCWFAFNCGSAESIETGFQVTRGVRSIDRYPFYGIPATIAINMIMAGASGGTVAILIAVWAQMKFHTESVNANEIANGMLSALVSITAGCAFVDYWAAVLIGVFGVILYHCGCYLEYLFKIKDTARVVPVHGVCGLWSVLATGLFMVGKTAQCNLHAAFEGLCYCELRLPHLNYGEQLGAQIIGALIMIGVGLVGSFIMYFILYIIPINPFFQLFDRILSCCNDVKCCKGGKCCKTHKYSKSSDEDDTDKDVMKYEYYGGWLLTDPKEKFTCHSQSTSTPLNENSDGTTLASGIRHRARARKNSMELGTSGSYVAPAQIPGKSNL